MQQQRAPNKRMTFDVRTVLARQRAGCNVSASVRMATHAPTALTIFEILVTKVLKALGSVKGHPDYSLVLFKAMAGEL